MVLPKRIIRDIDAICRGILWSGTQHLKGVAAVAWSKVFQAKSEGVLGLKQVTEWNISAIFEYVWAIAKKEDNIKYQITQGYQRLIPVEVKEHWPSIVWIRFNYPKHSFILWMAMLNRLKTKDRIARYNTAIDTHCLFCNIEEE
uniref:Reverse transcriptase zinc-binding domain-containing protein n=1 Tax=Cannabis sativa TaxID=3483 RepID=A0A803PAH0_CANSA